jgi:hypothetical protein
MLEPIAVTVVLDYVDVAIVIIVVVNYVSNSYIVSYLKVN